ncbi:MAG: PAS domain S-box protein, partial [Chitinophagaceae bacterium]
QQLITNERRYRALVENGNDAVAILSAEAVPKYVSSSVQCVLGYKQEEILLLDVLGLVHSEDIEGVRQCIAVAMENPGVPVPCCLCRVLHKNGSWRWIETTLTNMLDDPAIAGIVDNFRDVTEKKLAEEKIRTAKERYDLVVKATNEAVWDWDLESNNVYWDEAFRSLFGYDPEKDITTIHEWDAHIHPDDAQNVIDSVDAVTKSVSSSQWQAEYRFLKSNGVYANVLDRGFVMRDKNGKPIRMIGAMQDITDKLKADQDLRDSEEKRSLIMNAALDAIICMNLKGIITFWNPQAEKIFGWKAEEVIGRTLSEIIIPPAFRSFHDKGLENYAKTGHGPALNVLLELSAINRDNKEFPIELTVLPIRQEKEEFFCAFVRDITRRKTTEEQLKLSKERYDTVAKATNDVIYEWDIVNDVNYWSEGYEIMFGHKRTGDIMSADSWVNNLHPDEKENLFAATYEAFEKKQTSLTRELRFRCADGSYKTIFDKLVILYDKNDKPLKIVGAMQDITERKEHETAIINLNRQLNKRAEELAASNAELENFAYVASHDLQEPLRMVSSFLQLLEKKYKSELDETANQYINFAVDGADRMKCLILDLLEYSRVNTSQELRSHTEISDIINQVINTYSTKIHDTKAVIKLQLMPSINVNSTQMTQLFQNLIGNALKYNKSVAPEIEIGCEEKENEWQFFVKDNGIGIDPKFFDRVFIIFQRLHSKTQFSGTGIGLAICKKIVEKHGGKIWIESIDKKGCTFIFTLKK